MDGNFSGADKRFVEITAVLQGFHGLDDARQKNPDAYAEEISRAQDQVYVCNYRSVLNIFCSKFS